MTVPRPQAPYLPLLLTALALVVAAALPGAAGAGHEPTSVPSYTGCLAPLGALLGFAQGESPLVPCGARPRVHLSGGDITGVAAGPGLEGGSTQGAAVLRLRAQECFPGFVANGFEADATIACTDVKAGNAGISVVGIGNPAGTPDELEVALASQQCPPGEFATGVDDETGLFECAAGGAGGGITGVLAGGGLAGGGSSGDVTLRLGLRSCTPGRFFTTVDGEGELQCGSTHPDSIELCNGADEDCDSADDIGRTPVVICGDDVDCFGDGNGRVVVADPGGGTSASLTAEQLLFESLSAEAAIRAESDRLTLEATAVDVAGPLNVSGQAFAITLVSTSGSIGSCTLASGRITCPGGASLGAPTMVAGCTFSGGTFSCPGPKTFRIDHPLAPGRKWLAHAAVEAPELQNVYSGNVTTDARGVAIVRLPRYFEALNRDYRYQLTTIGSFAQAIVAKEIAGNRFTIRTSRPRVKVSWEVTGVRDDAYARTHPLVVEAAKGS